MSHILRNGLVRTTPGTVYPSLRHSTGGPSSSSAALALRYRTRVRNLTNMSELKPTLYNFLVYAPDYTDDECLSRRLSVRTQHLANAKVLKQNGSLKVGGAMVDPSTYESPNKKMIGSTLIYEAENIDVVRKLVEEDVYYKGGVWDKEKLAIHPFNSAFPLPTPPNN